MPVWLVLRANALARPRHAMTRQVRDHLDKTEADWRMNQKVKRERERSQLR